MNDKTFKKIIINLVNRRIKTRISNKTYRLNNSTIYFNRN